MSEFDPSTDIETTHILFLAGYSKKKTTPQPNKQLYVLSTEYMILTGTEYIQRPFTFHFLFPVHQYGCFGGKCVDGSGRVMCFFAPFFSPPPGLYGTSLLPLVFSLRLWHCPKRSVPLFIRFFSSPLNSASPKYHVFMHIACRLFVKKLFNSEVLLAYSLYVGNTKGSFSNSFVFIAE